LINFLVGKYMKNSMKIMSFVCSLLVSQQALPMVSLEKLSAIARVIQAADFFGHQANVASDKLTDFFIHAPVYKVIGAISLAGCSCIVLLELAIAKAKANEAARAKKRKREREERCRVACPYSAEEMARLMPIQLNIDGQMISVPGVMFVKNQWCAVQALAQGNAVGLYGPHGTYFMSTQDFSEELEKSYPMA
jgi:hypothetical protein